MEPKLRKCIKNAYDISVKNGSAKVDTEHVFLALLAIFEEKEGMAFKILSRLGIDVEKIIETEQ